MRNMMILASPINSTIGVILALVCVKPEEQPATSPKPGRVSVKIWQIWYRTFRQLARLKASQLSRNIRTLASNPFHPGLLRPGKPEGATLWVSNRSTRPGWWLTRHGGGGRMMRLSTQLPRLHPRIQGRCKTSGQLSPVSFYA
ncbi:hypothetical protein GGR56DRAFT_508138 [Xylariaceae sp. FL0804]|nr:hypothetical protein GGR56DRAFT_508138 [Xylariaceae sp. FL0804]